MAINDDKVRSASRHVPLSPRKIRHDILISKQLQLPTRFPELNSLFVLVDLQHGTNGHSRRQDKDR